MNLRKYDQGEKEGETMKRNRQVQFIAVAILAAGLSVQAQTYTWDNGNNDHLWGTSANWVGDPSLTFGKTTDIIFDSDSVVNRGNAVSIGGTRIIRSLTINADYETSNNGTFDIRTYTKFGGTANANLRFEADSGNASINVAQSTSGTAMVRLGSSNGGSVVIFSDLDLAQNNTYFGATGFQFESPVSGAGTINKTGAGLVRMVRDNAGWSGGMNINEGEVSVFANPDAMGTGTWTLGGGANNTTFSVGSVAVQANSGGITVADGAGTRTIALMSTTVGNPTLAGDITLNKDTFFDVGSYVSGTHDRLTATGAISGTGGMVKTGTGILELSGMNTYSGQTIIESGTLTLRANQTVGDQSELILSASAALVLDFTGSETVQSLSLDGGSSWLAPGTYTAAQLSALGSGTYSGSGSVNVLRRGGKLKLVIFS
jgi:fibronectin-binding autotransporter adhesin